MRGKVEKDIINSILEGYSIKGIPVHKDSEEHAKQNWKKIVDYELIITNKPA